MRVLVTGAAGFNGAAVCQRLLDAGRTVVGLDSLTPYYDVGLKRARLERLNAHEAFDFVEADVATADALGYVFEQGRVDGVVHLAAQVGVRYSLQNPGAYVSANLVGFGNVLEACRREAVGHLVFASSSSVYGGNAKLPYSVHDNVDHPISLYAATKKSNELMAHSYAHLFKLPCTGLRFFTVYGPWGRPDMAPLLFTKSIFQGQPIDVFNHGKMKRDFTYVDDIVEGVVRVLDRPPKPDASWDASRADPATSNAPYRIYNIGNSQPVELMKFIHVLEKCIGKDARLHMLPMQPGDVLETWADTSDLERDVGFKPRTPIETGLARMVEWYRAYHKL